MTKTLIYCLEILLKLVQDIEDAIRKQHTLLINKQIKSINQSSIGDLKKVCDLRLRNIINIKMRFGMNLGIIKCIKTGKVSVQQIVNKKQSKMVSGIRKQPTKKAFILITGFQDDEQADIVHHGGENKAILFFSTTTYSLLNTACKINFRFDDIAYYGENLVVSNFDESNVCVGDEFLIGHDVHIQITQPRQPCWKLSVNTQVANMTKIIFENGYTGWYARVLKEGEIHCDATIKLVHRPFPKLTIMLLNKLIINPEYDLKLAEQALECDALGYQFKRSLHKRMNGSSEMLSYQEL